MKNHQISVFKACEIFADKWLELAAEYTVFENRDAINQSYLHESSFFIMAESYGYQITVKEFVQQYRMSDYILKIKEFLAPNPMIDVDECLKRSQIPVTRSQYEIA